MTFLARVLRFLLWVVIISWGFRLVGRLFSGLFQTQQRPESTAGVPDAGTKEGSRLLVRDPVCGVHIAEVLAVPLREDGQLLHFCSVACRDVYVNSSRTLAANG